jgi:23S rRNA (guanosine2251-2'-O)-methyltransferase
VSSVPRRRPDRARRPRGAGAPGRLGPRGVGGEQVEGRQAVRELLVAGRRRVREVVFANDLDPAPILAEIEDEAVRRRVPVRRVARARLAAMAATDAPQGVIARADPLPEADLDDLARRRSGAAAPFLVVLDGVTDPQNLGAVLRVAECAGATGVVLPRHRAAHVTPAVTKAAAGAVEHLPIALVPGVPAALARLGELGVWTVGLDAGARRSLFALGLGAEPVALVLGAEGRGLSRLARARCDELVAIPLLGALGSLNVAAAAAVACYEVARARLG